MRKLVIALVVLVLLAVAADRVAKHVVEGRLADHIENRQQFDDVSVDVAGFPFLTQVVARHFDDVDIAIATLRARTGAGSIRMEDVDLALHDVSTSSDFTSATAAKATGSGLVPYSAFDAFAPVKVAYGGTTADGAGYLQVSAPSLGGGSLRVVPSAADGLRLNLGALSVVTRALPSS